MNSLTLAHLRDYCRDPVYKEFLETECPLTCKICGKLFTLAVQSYLPGLQ